MTLSQRQKAKSQLNHAFNRYFQAIHFVCHVFGISYFIRITSISSCLMNISYTVVIFTIFIVTFFYRISSVAPNFCKSDAISHSVIGIQQILSTITIITIYYQVLFQKPYSRRLLKFISVIEYEFVVLNIPFTAKRFMRKY